MKNKLILTFIIALAISSPVKADFDAGMDGFEDPNDLFYTHSQNEEVMPAFGTESNKAGYTDREKTLPPIKLLRMKLQEGRQHRAELKSEYAPTGVEPYRGEVATSDYASKEETEDVEDISSDDFVSEEQITENTKKKSSGKKQKAAENDGEDIILDCDNVDYDAPNYLIYAKGNVNVEFVKQGTVVKSDIITFDRVNNTIKAEGNVRIIKNGQTITGDYIFVDLNEENALIENPLTRTASIEMKAKKGYVYGDKIVQENGSIVVDKSYPIRFFSGIKNIRFSRMMKPQSQEIEEDKEKGVIKFTAKSIKINQKGDLETISIKSGKLKKGSRTIIKIPSIKIYTNKNHDYAETNIWEIASYRGLGFYTGPGVVFGLPKGAAFKVMPIFNYKSGAGFGAYGRFSSGTNRTMIAYGSAVGKVVGYGKQELDDNLFLQYAINGYMDEGFLGRRRPKYGVSLVYGKNYATNNFLFKNKLASFRHRFDAGYFQDLDFDSKFEKLQGRNIGTTRFRYMAMGKQDIFSYVNREKLKSFSFGVMSQMSAALYGTGDTQVIGRAGPYINMQYKRWMQTIGYTFAAYDDNTPMTVYDSYRFGTQTLYISEYLRLCKWLSIAWWGAFNVSNDSVNGRDIQSNAFYLSFGDHIKFKIGYDFIRQNLRCGIEVMTDAKGAKVEYDKLEIKQDKKSKKSESKPSQMRSANADMAPVEPAVLHKAVVENVKVMEDVL